MRVGVLISYGIRIDCDIIYYLKKGNVNVDEKQPQRNVNRKKSPQKEVDYTHNNA
jgi:hypothetical protein